MRGGANAEPSALALFSLSSRVLSAACSGVCLSDLRGAMVRWVCIVAVPKTDNSNFENDSRASVPKGGTIFSKAAADGTKKKRYQKKVHFGLALLPAFFLYRSKRLYKKLYRLVVRSQPPSRNKELRFQARPKCTFWSGIRKRFFLYRPKRL